MANTTIQLKKSATPSATPAFLANGELAINYADGKLFYKDSSGSIQQISSGGNTFSTVNAAGTLLIADVPGDVLTIQQGDNIIITGDAINDSFSIAANLSSVFTVANAAFNAANSVSGSIDVTAIYDEANAAYSTANAAYDKANSANVLAYNTGIGANAYASSVGVSANNYAGYMANAANAYAASLTPDLSPAFNKANDAYSQANAAYSHANDVAIGANAYSVSVGASSNAYVNVSTGAANAYSVTVGAASNAYTNTVGASANAWSNTKLSNTSGVVFNGNLTISSDLTISNNISNVTSIIFNTSTNRTPGTPGELTWSQDDSTLHFDMDSPNNVVGHIGQDLFYYVKNQTGSTIPKGTVVRFAGTLGSSGRLLIAPAIANNSYPSKYIIGVAAASISDGNDGFVISQGKIRGIDTSMFSDGDILYVSSTTPGGFSNTMPTAPNNKITVAAVIKSDTTQGSIEIRVTLGSKLNEDELAELNGLTNGDILSYVSSNGRFENKNTLVSAYNTANAAFSAGNTTAISANNYAGSMANAGNTWANTVGVSGNAYTNAVGISSNSWSNTVGASGNAYVNVSTISANNYAGAMANAANSWTNSSVSSVNAYVNTSTTAANNFAGSMANAANAYTNTYAQSVGAASNTYANNTFLKLTGGTLGGDLSVTGNLIITGNISYINVTNYKVQDSLIYLADQNYTSDVIEIGFIANYNNGACTTVHTGLFRSPSTKEYYLFQEYNKEPANNYIDIAGNNFTLSVLNADLITSNLTLGGANAITWITSAYGTANGGFTVANAAFDKANAANVLAYNTGIGANAYSSSVGVSANAYSDTLLVTGRAYTNTSVSSANAWSNTVGASANAYTNTVTTSDRAYTNTSTGASNTWANTVGASANGYTNTSTTASNTYASSVGTSANAYTNTVTASDRAYTNTSTGASNTWANTVGTNANNYANASFYTIANGSSAYNFANTINTFAYGVAVNAKAAFDKANTSTGASGGVAVSETAPSSPTANSLWWNSNTGRLLIYYSDVDTSQWVDASPVGEPGPQGIAASITVNSTTTIAPNANPTVTNSGTTSAALLDFGLPRSYTVSLGSTTTGAPNSAPTVTNGGNTTDLLLNFSIPRNNTTSVGTTTTGAPGTSASVSNSGTPSDIVLDFTIPRGNVGNTGPISPKSLSILSPLAGDAITLFFTNTALTLVEVNSVLVGGSTPSANFHVAYGTSRATSTNVFTSGCVTGATTTPQSNTTFNNSSVPANGVVWVTLNSVTGSPTEFFVSLRFTT